MTIREQDSLRQQAIAEAMSQLITNTNFQDFVGVLREQREVVIEDICRDDSVRDERVMLAIMGELRAVKHVIGMYDEYKRKDVI